MAHRSIIQRVLGTACGAPRRNTCVLGTGHSRLPLTSVLAKSAQRVITPGREIVLGFRRNESKEELTCRLSKPGSFSNGGMGMSSDSVEEIKGPYALSAILHPVRKTWDGRVSFISKGNVKDRIKRDFCDIQREWRGMSSVRAFKVGSYLRFEGHKVVHVALSAGARDISLQCLKGSVLRSFSSVPVVVEGTQDAVDGEQLNSLPAGLGDISNAESAVAGYLSEASVAAADCSYPTAFIQYFIEGVHVSTGLPWWASIVAATVAIRIMVLPIMVHQMKATARLTLMRPELEKLTNRVKESGYDPKVVEDNQLRMKALFRKYKTSPFSPILGGFIQAPLFMCFFFAIRNMAEKMESFKGGGALWFTDLSTPDGFYILPVLSGAFFLLTVEVLLFTILPSRLSHLYLLEAISN